MAVNSRLTRSTGRGVTPREDRSDTLTAGKMWAGAIGSTHEAGSALWGARMMATNPVTLVCWNIENKHASWRLLRTMEADVALLQEARPPPSDVSISAHAINNPGAWPEGRIGKVAVVRLSDRAKVTFIEESFATDPYLLAAARVQPPHAEAFIAVSICPAYEYPHAVVPGKMKNVASSLHRSISDLSAFIGRPQQHRVLVAGDFTVTRGPSTYQNPYWSAREQTIFDRMDALGLQCVGPEAPHGRQADPWPEWLPQESKNVPTFRRIGTSPADAEAQLDYVFASKGMVDAVRVRALNAPDEWGPSDHCRVVIDVG